MSKQKKNKKTLFQRSAENEANRRDFGCDFRAKCMRRGYKVKMKGKP